MKTIEEIAKQYEGNSCMDATRYRQCAATDPLSKRIEALKADVDWFNEHSNFVVQQAGRDLYELERTLPLP
jgi:hypothetical protein